MENVSGMRTDAPWLGHTAPAPDGVLDRLRARLRIAVGLVVVAAAGLLPGAATAATGALRSADYSGPQGAIHYELYVPSTYTPGNAVPLVVALHGCTETADSFRQLTRWDAQAEANGFIVVFPQQDSNSNYLKCWNFFQDGSMHRSAGDPARIAAVTSLIENTYNVDPHRVYVAGFSAGGAMASVMGATYPDYFAAIGVGSGCEYAATATCAGYRSADPTQAGRRAYTEMGGRAHPMPFIAFQGDADTTVPPVNSDQLVQQWLLTDDLADNGVADRSVPSTTARTTPGQARAGAYYTVSTYNDSHQAELAEQWVVRGMKHAWSGGDASQPYSDASGPDETAAMYAFFQSHPDPALTRPAPPPMPQPGASAKARPRVPTVSKPKLAHGRIVFSISGPGSVTLQLQQRVAGRLKNGRCVTGKTKRHGCTRYSTRVRIERTVAKAGRIAITQPKRVRGHKLPTGRYRAVVTPANPAGHTGRSRTVALVMR